MDTTTVKVGDRFYGPIPKYTKMGWHTGHWKVVQFEVVKVNKKSFHISWDKHTEKYPQIVYKRKQNNTFCLTELEVWKRLEKFHSEKKSPDSIDRKTIRQAKIRIKRLENGIHK